MTTVRVLLCDDVAELRELTRLGLEEHPAIEVVGEAADAKTGLAQVTALMPDLVLLDLSMPGMDGLEAIPLMREAKPDLGIIVFSGFASDPMERVATRLGADRYVQKGESFDRLQSLAMTVAGERRNGYHHR